MKRRMATLAIAGAMAVAAMAPATVFAATGQSDVYYKHGAGAPGGSDGFYVIVFPTNITFSSQDGSASQTSHDVSLQRTSDTVGLPEGLSVSLAVKSDNSMKLETETGTKRSVDYQIEYSVNNGDQSTVAIGSGISTNDNKIGTDDKGTPAVVNAQSDVVIATFTGEGTLKGSPSMDFVSAQTMKIPGGTELTDVLTYTATQTNPTVTN